MSEFIVADLKVKDDTGGNARLVLSGCVQTSPDVVNLKEPDRNERKDLKVDAYSCCRGDRSARAKGKKRKICWRILRFSSASDQDMGKRRNLCWKRDLRTDQEGVNTRTGTIQSAIVAAEVRNRAKEGYRFVLERQLPCVQICLLWNSRRSAAIGRARSSWTERPELPDLNRCPQIRVTTE